MPHLAQAPSLCKPNSMTRTSTSSFGQESSLTVGIDGHLRLFRFVSGHPGIRLKESGLLMISGAPAHLCAYSCRSVGRVPSPHFPRLVLLSFWPCSRGTPNCEFVKSGHVTSGGCVPGCSDGEGAHWNLAVSVQWSEAGVVPSRMGSLHIFVPFGEMYRFQLNLVPSRT